MSPENYSKYLEEKYKNIPFVYLDVPRIVPEQHFLETFKSQARPVLRLSKTNGYPFTREEAEIKAQKEPWFANEYVESGCNWKGMFLTPPTDTTMQHVYMDWQEHFPELYRQVMEYFPIRKGRKVKIRCWENLKPIGLHRDLQGQHPFPSSMRVILYDENPGSTFWMYPWSDDTLGWGYERLQVDDPKQIVEIDPWRNDSNAFMFNNYNWCHAARKDLAYSKILMFIEPAEYDTLDLKKLETLLDRSIKKYSHLK